MTVKSLLSLATLAGAAALAPDDGIEFFENEVRPLLARRCYECHGPEKQKAGLRLDGPGWIRNGSEAGAVLVAGDLDESLLIEAVRYTDEFIAMPPKGKLPDTEIATLEKWVAMGAPMPAGEAVEAPDEAFDIGARKAATWSLQPLAPGELPAVRDEDWVRAALDRHILKRLEDAGLAPAGAATRSAWLRRVSFDLTGLPPTPEDVAAFESDDSQHAFEAVVERLLASPRFGETWARHWLDLVRYAETKGHEFDYPIPNAWQYRDYLIRAFDQDVPYDQLLVEHVAGDLLALPRLNPDQGFNESVLGTGFWFLGEEVHSPVDIRSDQTDRTANQIDVFAKAFQGLTVACARCHDHKFDAISTEDYYALSGFVISSNYRQVRFESMETNREVAEDLATLTQVTAPEVSAALGASLQADAAQLAGYLEAVRDVEWAPLSEARPGELPRATDLLIEDFEGDDYLGWTATGTAFGSTPRRRSDLAPNQGDVAQRGAGLVSTYEVRNGEDGAAAHAHVGTLTSDPFVLSRDHVHFLVAGGKHEGTRIELEVDGAVVRKTSGADSNRLKHAHWDVRELAGKTARLRVIDEVREGWGHIALDHVVLADRADAGALEQSRYPLEVARIEAGLARAAAVRGVDAGRLRSFRTGMETGVLPFGAWRQITRAGKGDVPRELASWRGRQGASQDALDLPGIVHADYRRTDAVLFQDGFAFRVQAAGTPGLSQGSSSGAGPRVSSRTAAVADPAWHDLGLAPGTQREQSRIDWVQAGRTLITPSFELSGGRLWYLVRGAADVYAPIASHRLNNGPLHGRLVKKFDVGEPWRWVEHDLRRYQGERLNIEFTPRPARAPGAGAEFAIAAVIEADEKPADPTGFASEFAAALGASDIRDRAALADLYATYLARAARVLGAARVLEAEGVLDGEQGLEGGERAALLDLADAWLRVMGAPAAEVILAPVRAERSDVLARLVRESATAPAMVDGSGLDEYILIRGNAQTPGAAAHRRFLSAIDGTGRERVSSGSGRLELARRLTDTANPLTARLWVNRVWHHLFGRGIVASVDDFGQMGEAPSHPALLDRLARDFMDRGWSTKQLLREIVLSSTYRQSSTVDPVFAEADPDNVLLHHFPVQRLVAEALRDSILAVSGRLSSERFGPSVPIHLTAFLQGRGKPGESGPLDGEGRRSLYISVRRNFLVPMFMAFDFPTPATTIGRRGTSNVPAQALTLMNDPFVVGEARRWAERELDQAYDDWGDRVQSMYLSALARPASEAELLRAAAFLEVQMELHGGMTEDAHQVAAWADFAHVLFNLKEFSFLP